MFFPPPLTYVTLYDYYICDLLSANAVIGKPNVDGAI